MVREAARRAPRLQELGEARDHVEIARPERLGQLLEVLAQRLGVARPSSALRLGRVVRPQRGVGGDLALRAGRRVAPGRSGDGLDGVRAEPRLHEGAQALAAEREPALALGAVGHQHVLEATERALAVDGLGELPPELGVVDHRDEALHPAVLLARAHRIDAQVVAVRGDAHVHLRIGDAVDHPQDLAGRQVQVAVNLRCVVLECVLQRLPVHGYVTDRSRRGADARRARTLPRGAARHGSLPLQKSSLKRRSDPGRPLR